MRTALQVTLLLLLLAGGYLAGTLLGPSNTDTAAKKQADAELPNRIVSTAPSITEVLFALGAGDRLVGVTSYCNYPAEARDLPKVGGLLDPNFERVAALEPDLVVLLESAARHQRAFENLGLKTLVVPHRSLDDLTENILLIGEAVGREAEAERVVGGIRRRIERVEERVAGRKRPRVLMVIERDYSKGLQSMTAAASNASYDLFDRVIEIAGGTNACGRTAAPFPAVSTEGLLWLDPDVVVELVPPASERSLDNEAIRRQWQELPQLEAVKNDRVYVLDDDFAKIPGPRFFLLVEKLAELLHPRADGEKNEG